MIVGSAIMLLDDRQFSRAEPMSQPARLNVLPVTAVATFAAARRRQCDLDGRSFAVWACCPENPGGYLIFNDNLSLTMLGQAP